MSKLDEAQAYLQRRAGGMKLNTPERLLADVVAETQALRQHLQNLMIGLDGAASAEMDAYRNPQWAGWVREGHLGRAQGLHAGVNGLRALLAPVKSPPGADCN